MVILIFLFIFFVQKSDYVSKKTITASRITNYNLNELI